MAEHVPCRYCGARSPENTRTAYRRAWGQFESWCEQYGFTALPCGELTLANYVASIVITDLVLATIDQAIACILSQHELVHQFSCGDDRHLPLGAVGRPPR